MTQKIPGHKGAYRIWMLTMIHCNPCLVATCNSVRATNQILCRRTATRRPSRPTLARRIRIRLMPSGTRSDTSSSVCCFSVTRRDARTKRASVRKHLIVPACGDFGVTLRIVRSSRVRFSTARAAAMCLATIAVVKTSGARLATQFARLFENRRNASGTTAAPVLLPVIYRLTILLSMLARFTPQRVLKWRHLRITSNQRVSGVIMIYRFTLARGDAIRCRYCLTHNRTA
jgi:hypothetical protein